MPALVRRVRPRRRRHRRPRQLDRVRPSAVAAPPIRRPVLVEAHRSVGLERLLVERSGSGAPASSPISSGRPTASCASASSTSGCRVAELGVLRRLARAVHAGPRACPRARAGAPAALWHVCGCEPRFDSGRSARLAVRGVAPAPAAVLAQLESLGVVPLALVRLVVPALALFACESGGDPDVSTGHLRASRLGMIDLGCRVAGAMKNAARRHR